MLFVSLGLVFTLLCLQTSAYPRASEDGHALSDFPLN